MQDKLDHHDRWIVALFTVAVLALVALSLADCSRPPPAAPWPPPAAVVDAMPAQATPTAAPAAVTPAADPSPATATL